MALTKPNKDLRRDLKDAAFAIEDAANELFKVARRLEEAEFIAAMGAIARLHGHADILKSYADEVADGKMSRDA